MNTKNIINIIKQSKIIQYIKPQLKFIRKLFINKYFYKVHNIKFNQLKNPKISIVLPVYNQANFICEAIDSIINQTYTNWELIVINDGSTDNLEAQLIKYANHKQIIVHHQNNQKIPQALNNGFKIATGKLYTWTSADNILQPNQLLLFATYFIDHHDCAMVYSNYMIIDESGAPLYNSPTSRPENQNHYNTSMIELPNKVNYNNLYAKRDCLIGASFMYRSEVAKVIGAYDINTFGGEDYDYWLRIYAVFKNIHHINQVLYKYRLHGSSITGQMIKTYDFTIENNRKLLMKINKKRWIFIHNAKLIIKQNNQFINISLAHNSSVILKLAINQNTLDTANNDIVVKYNYINGEKILTVSKYILLLPNIQHIFSYWLFNKINNLDLIMLT